MSIIYCTLASSIYFLSDIFALFVVSCLHPPFNQSSAPWENLVLSSSLLTWLLLQCAWDNMAWLRDDVFVYVFASCLRSTSFLVFSLSTQPFSGMVVILRHLHRLLFPCIIYCAFVLSRFGVDIFVYFSVSCSRSLFPLRRGRSLTSVSSVVPFVSSIKPHMLCLSSGFISLFIFVYPVCLLVLPVHCSQL